MCGICGVVGMQRTDLAEDITRRMMGALRHRGPDEDGLIVTPGASLGMRRLSIIDLPGGRQPMFNERGNVAVVFNGEIYNFLPLRARLQELGHVFRSNSDTEVIVHAYEEWGERCVRELRGMFAFAVWDARVSGTSGEAARGARIFLARDRLGIKPLYYSFADGAVLFASEVRALLASGCVPPRVAADALESYLLFGSVAEPGTLVEGVSSLLPGHSITLAANAPTSEFQPKRYWEFVDAALHAASPRPKTLQEAARQLRPLLEETVRDHLMADVPLGVFLSSGLDSTALVALAKLARSDLHTLTIAFPEQGFSEAKVSRETAKHFQTNHQELLLTPGELLAQLDEAIDALDQPTMDGMNTYFISRAAHQAGFKVALSGLGGDELFGGYSTYAMTPRAKFATTLGRFVPGLLRRWSATMAVKIAPADGVRKAAAAWRSARDFPHAYYFTRLVFTPYRVRRLLAPYFASVGRTADGNAPESPWRECMREAARQARSLDSFSAVSWLELRSYLVNTLLRDTDSVSMANSLEVRVPLLDHRVVEFVAPLPKKAKHRRDVRKALLVEALSDVLPREVLDQPKRTFTFPWQIWLRGPLGARLSHSLTGIAAPLQPYLNQRSARGIWQEFVIGQTNWSRPWSLYVLNEWVNRHLTDAATAASRDVPAIRPAAVADEAPDRRG